MFDNYFDTTRRYKDQIKADLKIWKDYADKVIPEEAAKYRKSREGKLLSAFYKANLGFDPEEEKSASQALVKVEYKVPKMKADDLRTIWAFAVDHDLWWKDGCASLPKSKFTLYNPEGKPFRIKARMGSYIKATPVGIFVLAFDIVINNHTYLKEGFINLKHVRWVIHPFTALSRMKPQDRVLIELVTGLTGKTAVPSIRAQKATL